MLEAKFGGENCWWEVELQISVLSSFHSLGLEVSDWKDILAFEL